MRPQKVDHEHLMSGLMSVLRANGFEGTSMVAISEATGLKKASLYYRFPGGKKEMVEEVLNHVKSWSVKHISDVLTNKKNSPQKRLGVVLDNINILYDGGRRACILKAISTESGLPLFGTQIKEGFKLWIDAFTTLALDFGYEPQTAYNLAKESLVRIQGALILSKGLGDLSPFRESLESIEKSYLQKAI